MAAALIAFSQASSLHAQGKTTYQDQLLPIIEANCSQCHNPDKRKADLDLTSFQALLKGSGSGAIVVSGNPDSSKLWKALTHAEDPFMPPNRPKLSDADLETVKKWIAGGLLETADGKAIVASGPSVDLSLKPTELGKPEGPPPMPEQLSLQPVVHTIRGNAVIGLASSPWAPLIAVAGQRQVLLFNATSLQLLGILPFSEGEPMDVRFSQNGKLLLAAGGRGATSGRVVLWNVLTGEHVITLGDDFDTVLSADIRPDQSLVALGGPNRLVKIFSTKTGDLQHKLKKHTDWVTAVAFSPNGQMLASADRNGGITIWEPETGQELFTLAGHKAGVTSLCWRSDSKLLASGSEDGTVKLWEMEEGKQFKSWNAHAPGVLCVQFARDGRLVSCGRDQSVTLWNAGGGKLHNFKFFGNLPLRVTFNDDNTRVFASDFAGRIAAWNTADGKELGELDPNPPAPAQTRADARR